MSTFRPFEFPSKRATKLNKAIGEGGGGNGEPVSVDSIVDATDIGKSVMKAASAAEARTVIGAGTSSVAIGTGASQAAAGNHTHGAATTSAAGFMSAADKVKLDGVAANANAYVLPAATATVVGGVKIASSTVATGAVATLGTAADRTYMTQVNGDGQVVVNVPWVNTTYTLPAAGTALGGVRRGVAVADATEETLLVQFNELLASLRTAGVISA